MAFIYDLTDTWNAGGTAFNAIRMNVTDTASAAASRLLTLQVGGVERFSVDKAGIGTFASVVRAAGGSTTAPTFSFGSDTNTGMWSPAADTIAFSEGGVERMRLDASGNVVVGKELTDPAIVGHVFGATGNLVTTRDANVCHTLNRNTSDGAIVQYRRDNVAVASIVATTTAVTYNTSATSGITGGDGNTITIRTNNAERMRVTSAGLVGIGMTSPEFPVDVSGILRATDIYAGTLSSNSPGFGNTDTGVHLDGGFTSFFSRNDGGNNGVARFNRNASDGALIVFSRDGDQIGFIGAASSGLTFAAGGTTERMRITAAGNVGIGTTNPTFTLQVNGTGYFNSNVQFFPQDGFRFTSVSAVSAMRFGSAFTGESTAEWAYNRATGATSLSQGATGSALNERMRISSAGNLGLGMSGPVARLNVAAGGQVNAPVLGNVTNYPAFFSNNDSSYGLGIGSSAVDGRVWLQAQRSDSAVSYNITLNEAGGNVGIGTSNPSRRLTVSATGTDARMNIVDSDTAFATATALTEYWGSDGRGAFTGLNGGVYSIFTDVGVPMNFLTAGSERMRIDASGNIGIGNSSPGYRLDITAGDTIAGLGYGMRLRANATANGGSMQFTDNAVTAQWAIITANTSEFRLTADGRPLTFFTGGAERARIDSSGNLLVGTTGTEGPSRVSVVSTASSTACISYRNTAGAGSTYAYFLNAANSAQIGSITNNGNTGTLYNIMSDARLKHDIVDAPEASSLIDAMQVRSFKWNFDDSEQRYGFVAQELVEIAPEAVSVPADEDQMMGVDYSKLVPMLVKEIQSLRARVAQLEGN
jgi:hypothetical protein